MADWDADDFDPDADGKLSAPKVTDKWDGEDEDDDIKDAWDAESEEENSQKEAEEKVVRVKKKKTLAQKIAEKEEAAEKAAEERLKREEEEKQLNTPEGKLEEKLRLQKIQEDNDLKLAAEMLGGGGGGGVIDNMNPSSKEEFEKLTKAITDKVNTFESSELYQDFVEDLVKNLCMGLTCQTLKKCKTHVEAFHSAKLKEEKAAKDKSKKGKTEKKSLKMDSATGYYDGYDDMDDFM